MLWEVMEIQIKTCSTIFSSLSLAVCFVITTQAQQPAGKTAGSSPPSTGASSFKIMVIEMEAFFDPENGISSVVRAIEGLNQEFGPLKKEMQGLEQRYQALADEIAKARSTTDSRALQEKRFQAESLRRGLRNKAEDAGREFMKRLHTPLHLLHLLDLV